MPAIPNDYAERVYAGVLGKLIGVYLGRPFEGWTYERIMKELGPINFYVNERRDVALRSHHLVVTDDDISGTFAFPRALADCGFPERLTSRQIGNSWLNYIVEDRSILWWGGLGNSTEHTAYLRLKSGIPAPQSGSIELNGKTVAEQIGAQIFIDGWAMVSPGNPEQAAYLAEQAGRVSHDGESVHAAKLLAAMEAQAFVEADIQKLLDVGLRFVPGDCLVRRVVEDVRGWHAGDNSDDWERTRALIAQRYGYDKFKGNCHVIPNHALIILATLYGADNFQSAMRIANTAGWDTDCNAGNVGCLFGIRKGLAGIDAGPDFRKPVADRMYVSTADGGASITDAVIEANALIQAGHILAGSKAPAPAKNGARFNFEFPGSLQGFSVTSSVPVFLHDVEIGNVEGHSRDGHRSLAIGFRRLSQGRVARVATPTFFDKDVFTMPIYQLLACPTLYSGQDVECRVEADPGVKDVSVRLFASVYNERDELSHIHGERQSLGRSRSHPVLARSGYRRLSDFRNRARIRSTGPVRNRWQDLPRLSHLGRRARDQASSARQQSQYDVEACLGEQCQPVSDPLGGIARHERRRHRFHFAGLAGLARLPRQVRDHAAARGGVGSGRPRAGTRTLLCADVRRG